MPEYLCTCLLLQGCVGKQMTSCSLSTVSTHRICKPDQLQQERAIRLSTGHYYLLCSVWRW